MPETITPTPTPATPSAPTKDEILAKYKGRATGAPINRRGFFLSLGVAWTAMAAALGGMGAAIFAFMIPRVDWGKPTTARCGPPDRIAPNTVDETYKLSDNIWLVRDNEKIVALLAVCTHLGCTPNWAEGENKFKCPCHGSGFRGVKGGQLAGINFEGPAPVPLQRCKISLADDGQIVVDKGQLYEWAKGGWENPNSYLRV